MNNNLVKTIITAAVVLVAVVLAWKLLQIAISIVLPIAVLIVIAYVIYLLITGRKA